MLPRNVLTDAKHMGSIRNRALEHQASVLDQTRLLYVELCLPRFNGLPYRFCGRCVWIFQKCKSSDGPLPVTQLQ